MAGCKRSSEGARALADDGDDALILPEGLAVSALAGGNGVLELVALTLRRGASGSELYAALKNTGEVPACSAALSVELFDAAEQSLAAGISGLLTQHFYRRSDGSGAIAACVGPGDVTMAAITDLPAELVIEDVATVVYRCPYFALEVDATSGLSVEGLKRTQVGDQTLFRGTLHNGLDVAVRNPSVTIFPVNRVGRPLGAAIASAELELMPHATWEFEVDSTLSGGRDLYAYPAGALEK